MADSDRLTEEPTLPVDEIGLGDGFGYSPPTPVPTTLPVNWQQTVADLVAAQLREFRQHPPSSAAPPPPAALPALQEDGRIPITVRLQPFHAEYLFARAAAFGEPPERMLETILREFKRDDRFRPNMNTAPSGPGAPAGTARR